MTVTRASAFRKSSVNVLLGWLALTLLSREGVAEDAPKLSGLRIDYDSKGVSPGSREEPEVLRQRLTVDDSGLRLELLELQRREPSSGKPEGPEAGPTSDAGACEAGDALPLGYVLRRRLVLRMDRDPPVIWEILDGSKYREYEGDLNDLQRERRVYEKNELEFVKRYPKKDRDAFFKEFWWLRPDGSREVTVVRKPGETILGRRCEHIRVLENGREIIDAQVATEGAGARSYFHLYRRLGAFSEEVLEKIQGIQGLPLKGRITIVTALPTQTWEVEARSVTPVSLPSGYFDLPAGAVKLEEEPKEISCAFCGKRLDVPANRAPAKGRSPDGKWLYFCSEEHAEKYFSGESS